MDLGKYVVGMLKSESGRVLAARQHKESVRIGRVDLVAADEQRFAENAVERQCGGVVILRVVFGHYDKIEAVGVCRRDQLVKTARAVPAQARVNVDVALVFGKVGVSGGGSLRLDPGDLVETLAEDIPPVDERNLHHREDGEQRQKYLS